MASQKRTLSSMNRLLFCVFQIIALFIAGGCGILQKATPAPHPSDEGGSNPPEHVDITVTPSPSPTPDPWEGTRNAVNSTLDASNIESHLADSQAIINQITGYISIIEEAQPALDVIDELRGQQVKLFGLSYSAYDLLIGSLEAAQPGTGEAITQLEEAIRLLMEINNALNSSSVTLSNLSAAIANYRSSPTEANLVSVQTGIETASLSLSGVECDLKKVLAINENLTRATILIQNGLAGVQNLLPYPVVGDAVRTISSAITDVVDTIRPLGDAATAFGSQLSVDVLTLTTIRGLILQPQGINPSSVPLQVVACGSVDAWNPGTVSSRSDPKVMVGTYWNLVSNGNYAQSWDMLSPSFQQRMHQGDYSNYVNGYQKLKVCSIETSNLKVEMQDASSAIISAHVKYRSGDSCALSEYDFLNYLVFDTARNVWLYEKGNYK